MKVYLRLVAARIVAATIVTLFVASCGAPATAPTTTAAAPKVAPTLAAAPSPVAPTPATTATPLKVPYGELRVGLSNFAGGALDPQILNASGARPLGSAIFDSLVGVAPEGGPAPAIAERWDMSPDGKTWTFFIRKGVKFHDGTDLTSADVKFSLERTLAQDAAGTNATLLRNAMASVEVPDNYTVVLSLKNPDPEIWKWLSAPVASEGMIVPKKYVEDKGVQYFRDHLVGAGPWKVVKYDFNNELQLEAVENHYRVTPQFKKLTIKNIPEQNTRFAMLRTGDLDVIDITPEKAAEVKSAGLRVVAIDAPTQGGFSLYPDVANPKAFPIGDVRVRRGLSLAINRQEMADKLFSGYARPSAITGMASTSLYFDANVLKPDPYDPTQAKALLAEAGYPNGFSMKLFPAMLFTWQSLHSEALAGYWEKIGIKATLDVRDYSAVRPLFSPAPQPALFGNSIGFHSPPYAYFGLRVPQHSQGSHKNHNNKEVDAAIDKTEATVDMVERKKLGLQAAVLAKQNYTFNATVEISDLLAVGKNVGEWQALKGYAILGMEYEKMPHAR